MLDFWARVVNRKAWYVLIIGLILILVAGVYGTTVFSHLSNGNDFQDPSSPSTIALNLSTSQFSNTQYQLLVLFSSTNYDVNSPTFAKTVQNDLAIISKQPHVVKVLSYYNSGDHHFVSTNSRSTYAAVTLNGSSAQQQQVYTDISKDLTNSSGPVQIRLGGNVSVSAQINQQITSDLKRAETLSLPIVAVLLILIFGNLIAPLVPLALGGLSIFGALFIIRILTEVTTMSSYVINVITLLGLGLAIDYSLFLVGRFREELAITGSSEEALKATVKKAGRTIMFSGSTVIISLLSLLVFPQVFLRSMGMAGAAVVAIAVILALTIVPASLRILGKHINALSLPGRNLNKKHDTTKRFWYRFSRFVMKRPVQVLIITFLILLGIGSQFLHAKLSEPDISSIPTNLSSRQVNDALVQNFAGTSSEPISIIIRSSSNITDQTNLQYLQNYTTQLEHLKGVIRVDSLLSNLPSSAAATNLTEVSALLKSKSLQPILQQYVSGQYEQLSVYQTYAPQSPQAQQLIHNIRNLAVPTGFNVYVGGVSAALVDLLHSLREHLPYALIIIFCATTVLIFLLMGGILVPIKAVILGVISLSAAFGILVWVFQDHHFSGVFSLSTLGSIDATSSVLIFAIAFGLSMDYEFFLLSRIKEEYEKTNDNMHSVAHGVQKTASIITSAALLLISVIGLFTISKISLIEQIGLGLAVAVAIDSTLVRMIMVPATMRLLGKANWWAPKPLRFLYRKFGLHD